MEYKIYVRKSMFYLSFLFAEVIQGPPRTIRKLRFWLQHLKIHNNIANYCPQYQNLICDSDLSAHAYLLYKCRKLYVKIS